MTAQIVKLRDHRQPLRSPEQAAEQFMRWSTNACQAAELAMQSQNVHVALDWYGYARECRKKAHDLLGVEDREEARLEVLLREIEALMETVNV